MRSLPISEDIRNGFFEVICLILRWGNSHQLNRSVLLWSDQTATMHVHSLIRDDFLLVVSQERLMVREKEMVGYVSSCYCKVLVVYEDIFVTSESSQLKGNVNENHTVSSGLANLWVQVISKPVSLFSFGDMRSRTKELESEKLKTSYVFVVLPWSQQYLRWLSAKHCRRNSWMLEPSLP